MDRELAHYLREKGWEGKLVEGGTQVLIKNPCPFCGKDKHLMFNTTTTKWDCKRCGESGNLLTMKRRLGDLTFDVRPAREVIKHGKAERLEGARPPAGSDLKFSEALLNGENESALSYLHSRGFTNEILAQFKIGVAGKDEKALITIPHYSQGELVCFKFRTVPPAKKGFSRFKDCPSVLFNADSLSNLANEKPSERVVIVCEAETDCMAWVQLGFKYVVASTIGASIKDWPASWLIPLEPATTIYLAFDNDDAGHEGANKASTALGKWRCRRVVPPLHDFAECLEAGLTRADFDEALKRSAVYEERSVKPTSEFKTDLLTMLANKESRGRSTGFLSLDAMFGGLRDGEQTVLTGDTGSGKSTWAVALIRNQAKQRIPVMIAPFEQKPHVILGKLVGMEAKSCVYDLKREELESNIDKVLELPIYFLDKHGPTSFSEIKDAIRVAFFRFGVKVFLIDHLHFFMDCRQEQERFFIKTVLAEFQVLATDLGIHIILVVHPTKLGKDANGVVRRVELDDLKGSSDIKQIPDNVIRVFRQRSNGIGSQSDDTEISVLKCRSQAGSEGSTWFYFTAGELYVDAGVKPVGKRFAGGTMVSNSENEKEEDWTAWNEPQ